MDGVPLYAHGLEALVCSAPIATPRIAPDAGSVPSAGRHWPWPVRRVALRMSRELCGGCGTPLSTAPHTAELRIPLPQAYMPSHLTDKSWRPF